LPLGVTFERLTPPCVGGTAAVGTATLSQGFVCRAQSGSLLLNDQIEYTLVVSVSDEARGSLVNRVSVGSAGADLDPENNSDQVSVQVQVSRLIYLPLVSKDYCAPGTLQFSTD
jgi:hypothetical protein